MTASPNALLSPGGRRLASRPPGLLQMPAGWIQMVSFGLKLAFGVALFQLTLMATLFGQYTRG